jgi:hypothetical protein
MKKFSEIPKEILDQLEQVAEEYFDTSHHQDQMPVNEETQRKLSSLTPYWVQYATSDGIKVISSIVVVPTQKELALKFVNKEISEKQLMDLSQPAEKYSALYLCSGITLPEYRRQGLVKKLFQETIKYIPLTKDALFFAWPTTELGNQVVEHERLESEIPILIRKS